MGVQEVPGLWPNHVFDLLISEIQGCSFACDSEIIRPFDSGNNYITVVHVSTKTITCARCGRMCHCILHVFYKQLRGAATAWSQFTLDRRNHYSNNRTCIEGNVQSAERLYL